MTTKTNEETTSDSVQELVDDVHDRAKKYGFKPNTSTVREAVLESADLYGITLTDAEITAACQLVLAGN